MLEVEVLLVVIGSKLGKPLETKILLAKTEDNRWGDYALPRETLTNSHSSQQVAAYLLKKYTGLQAMVRNVGWIPLLQKKIIDNTDRTENGYRCVGIPYLALLPDIVKVENAEWYNMVELCNMKVYKDHLVIINSALTEG